MRFATWPGSVDPIVATAIHAGHELRGEVAAAMTLDEELRRREEDVGTATVAASFPTNTVVHRSRFEVDLNRERHEAVYSVPGDAWGLDLWGGPLDEAIAERSRRLHDGFYRRLSAVLDLAHERHGGFVVYDIHSYNHRRGPEREPAPVADNPLINLGTGSLPHRWRPVAEAFLDSTRSTTFAGAPVDAGENVKFAGRHLAAFVHDAYGEVGCVLAIELKKVYMDEWTGEIHPDALAALAAVVAATTGPVLEAHRSCR